MMAEDRKIKNILKDHNILTPFNDYDYVSYNDNDDVTYAVYLVDGRKMMVFVDNTDGNHSAWED